MNGRWKEGGLVIELFKTTRASMKFDRMITSESSWLMGIKVQRVLNHAHSAMEPGKTFSRGGNRHWLIAVDEFSDCSHSFFLSR